MSQVTPQDIKAELIARWTKERDELMQKKDAINATLKPYRDKIAEVQPILDAARAAIKAAMPELAAAAQQIAMLTRAIGPTHSLKAEVGTYATDELAAAE